MRLLIVTQAKQSNPALEVCVKAIILAGGLGTRLSEETSIRPKPMVEIGGRPILWHVMKTYSHYGINDFIVCLGYKGYLIKEYFSNYYLHASDVTIDIQNNKVEMHRNASEPWRITLIDTGADTMTGGRLKRVLPYVKDEETFCFTYGDGVSNVDISALLAFHKNHGRLVTLTATRPTSRFGALDIAEDGAVTQFTEKPPGDGRWINGGYFVLSPKVGAYIKDDTVPWERQPMETLAREGQVAAYKHDGFWQPMDTMHDRNLLEDLWSGGAAPWKVW
jgi:glucose-1-phosphate cytidylyltransferase